jgi:hypothetical protein
MLGPFRGNIDPLSAPGRKAWEAEHGEPCVKLDIAGAPHIEQARRVLNRDLTSLTADEAIAARTDMDALCERVLTKSILSRDEYRCFFDPETKAFWAYPS